MNANVVGTRHPLVMPVALFVPLDEPRQDPGGGIMFSCGVEIFTKKAKYEDFSET